MNLGHGDLVAGKFRIQDRLGEGGMGVVFAAEDIVLGRSVALKVLPESLAADEEMTQRFIREAIAAAQLDNDHAVRIFDQGKLGDGTPYIVMERLNGEDLDAVLERETRFPLTKAVDTILEACVALHAAHNKGIVHRDLKPGNLFLHRTESGKTVVKVLDFGIAKLLAAPKGGALTRTNQQLGTPLYMSPEQHLGDRVDARTDIWALGVMLFELVSGTRPFEGETFGRVLQAVCNEEPPDLENLAQVPTSLASVIRRCLSKNPELRPPNVQALVAELAPFASPGAARLVESLRPPPSQVASASTGQNVVIAGPSPSSRAADSSVAETKIAVTKEASSKGSGRAGWAAAAILAVVAAAAWFTSSIRRQGDEATARAEHPSAASLREASAEASSHKPGPVPAQAPAREAASARNEVQPAPSSVPEAAGPVQSEPRRKAATQSAAVQKGASAGSIDVHVTVAAQGRSCAAQPGGTQLTLVVGDFSQRRSLNGCRTTFVGVPAKYKGKTASFAGVGGLCSLAGGGPLGAHMVARAKRRGPPCSADGIAACECKNPCLGHECL